MTRPLKYDDQFKSILNDKIHDKFLYFFEIKVQSTAFCKAVNLQISLIIASFYDIIIGLLSLILFIKAKSSTTKGKAFSVDMFIQVCGIFFGILGFNCATTLMKKNIQIYKSWRIFVTFAFLFFELVYGFPIIEQFVPNTIAKFIMLIVLFGVNMYFTRIAWSFFIRLERGHELLIIHGKYLESMMMEEYKVIHSDMKKKYQPPIIANNNNNNNSSSNNNNNNNSSNSNSNNPTEMNLIHLNATPK